MTTDSCRSADGTTIAYETSGRGPGLVFLSGAIVPPGGYAKMVDLLAADYTVHYVHRRGRGESGPQGASYSIARECEDAEAVAQQTGARLLSAHSFGGFIAVNAALRPQSPWSAIAVYDAAVPVDGSVPMEFLPGYEKALREGRTIRAFTMMQRGLQVAPGLGRLPAGVHRLVSAALLATVGRDIRATLPTLIAEGDAAAELDGPIERYRPIATPLLLMTGEHSAAYFRTAARGIADVTGNAKLIELAGHDHNSPLLKPDRIVAETRAFLAQVPEATA
ncbi:alpha/beta fold hydrolase [Amycolatopsis jejuensis]|uniref:alpha/beta fold hydrolase n=1 Tax=Amycolatopsis jejuensis TaxID=330084 RepID=UPI00068D6F42|nr:alpha/beta hydrolase [Amycolatopsis jejuensis]